MAIPVPVAGTEISAAAYGIPVVNEVNRLGPLVDGRTPTAWTALPLSAGFTPAGGYQAPQYRKVGDQVFVRGTVERTPNTPADVQIATFPSGFRPLATVSFMCQVYGSIIRTDIGSSGTINALASYFIGTNAGNWSYYVLDNIAFSTIA